MKSKFFFISIIVIMLVSCTMTVDMEGEGIDNCEILFTNDNGEINCRDLINKYFSESEIEILNKRVQSVRFVEKDTDNNFGTTYWYTMKFPSSLVEIVGNKHYCKIELNLTTFDKYYKTDTSDAKDFMIQVTLIRELCHVIWSGPDAPAADETVPSAVSRKGHNEFWYYGYKDKVINFVNNNNMQAYRIKSALSKYGYEEFGSEYDYIPGARCITSSSINRHDDCCLC